MEDHARPMNDHPRTGNCQDLAEIMLKSCPVLNKIIARNIHAKIDISSCVILPDLGWSWARCSTCATRELLETHEW